MWIGVECNVPYEVLEKWGVELERSGSHGGAEVGEFLRRCGRLVNGSEASSVGMRDRMLEIEMRAVENVERKRSDVLDRTGRILGEIVRQENMGVTVENVMSSMGIDGWRGGRTGGKNGGVKKSRELGVRRKRVYRGGGVVRSGADGSVVSTAERRVREVETADSDVRPKRGGGRGVWSTLQADRSYALSFKGWCATQLRMMGFKMQNVATAIGEDKSQTWKILSGYERYWKRQRLAGVLPPEPSEEWKREFENIVMVAAQRVDGNHNATLSLNGTGKEERKV